MHPASGSQKSVVHEIPSSHSASVVQSTDATAQYRPPMFNQASSQPPQTIISDPVQTAVCSSRGPGTFGPEPVVSDDGVHESIAAMYRPPVFKVPVEPSPPQTIISVPSQMAV
jgi:hypothetical protein